MTRKRRVVYPPPRSSKGPAPVARTPMTPPSLVTIDLDARIGRSGLVAGMRATILGSGPDAGQIGLVERLVAGVIPAAVVRTDDGRTRRIRTIDLAPVANPSRRPDGEAGVG